MERYFEVGFCEAGVMERRLFAAGKEFEWNEPCLVRRYVDELQTRDLGNLIVY